MPAPVLLDLSFLSNPNADRLDRLGYQLWRRMAGGNVTADSPYTLNECKLALEQYRGEKQAQVNKYNAGRLEKYAIEATEYFRKQYYEDFEALYKLGGSVDAWVRSFTLQVFADADRGLSYCVLPTQFVDVARYQNLPGEEGIRLVEYVPYGANFNFRPRFIPFPTGQHHNFRNVYRGGLQGNTGFWRDDDGQGGPADRVYFSEKPTEDKLRVSLVIRPTRDGLPQPGLLADVSDMDMEMGAEAILLRKVPEDLVNDNKPVQQAA